MWHTVPCLEVQSNDVHRRCGSHRYHHHHQSLPQPRRPRPGAAPGPAPGMWQGRSIGKVSGMARSPGVWAMNHGTCRNERPVCFKEPCYVLRFRTPSFFGLCSKGSPRMSCLPAVPHFTEASVGIPLTHSRSGSHRTISPTWAAVELPAQDGMDVPQKFGRA